MITSRRARAAGPLFAFTLAACAIVPPTPLPARHPALPGPAAWRATPEELKRLLG